MAFNPFHWFRKHQKVVFAGLTILCMIVFIGQFGGGGDVFQVVLGWFGAGRHAGLKVITLNGKPVTSTQLDRLARQRRAANDFLFDTAWKLQEKAIAKLLTNVKSTEPDYPLSGVRKIVQDIQNRSGTGMFRQQGDTRPQIRDDFAALLRIATRDKVKDNPERLQILQDVATLLGFQFWLAERPQAIQMFLINSMMGRGFSPPRDLYFGGSVSVDGLLDFMVWRHQADRLGVTLTDADVAKEINSAGAGQDVFDEKVKSLAGEKAIIDFLKRMGNYNMSPQDLVAALREEYRVVMAHGLLLGWEPGVRQYRSLLGATESPAVGTPDQFYEFYREQRTTLRVKMLPVQVSAFLDKVTQPPTEAELRHLFDRFRDQEPSPSSRDPGFKEPRRIAVEYVTGSPDTPFYRESARRILPASRAVGCLGVLSAVPAGAPPIAGVLPVLTPLMFDPVLIAYNQYKKDYHSWVNPDFEDREVQEKRIGKLHDVYVYNKWNIASTVGNLAGATAGVGGPFSAVSTLYGTSNWDEVKASLKQSLALLLARADPRQAFSAAALAVRLSPEPKTPAQMRPQLVYELEQKLAVDTLQGNLNAIRTELAKLRGKDKAAISPYLKKAVEKYHLTLHAMPRAMQKTEMIDALNKKVDIGIQGLVDAFLARSPGQKIENFVEMLFQGTGVYDPQSLSGTSSQRTEFLYWRSVDLPARIRSFAIARPDVVKAWKFREARKLARKDAERLEAEINSKKWGPSDAERFLREQKLGQPFELDNVSQLVTPPREVHITAPEYRRYEVPPDKANLLPYPPNDMVRQLLELKRPGEAKVIVDQPARTFYVTVLFNRDEPTVKQFTALYAMNPGTNALYQGFLEIQRNEYWRGVMEQLRREAGKVGKDGRFELVEGYRKSEGGEG